MARTHAPRRLDVAALARDGAALEGRWPIEEFGRLLEGTLGKTGAAPEVEWSARGEQRPVSAGEAQVWLHLDARAEVSLECQRCLQPMAVPLVVHTALRFVEGEDRAEREDEASEEDVLALGPSLDLHELAEDELILALPLVPRHDDCALPAPAGNDAAGEANPFAVLEQLRRGRGPAG